uniref:Putative secreted protein n=1 Tax=Anopheles marajoara TaxID=58244 RepID=A0A2M4C824_9DIPT
MRCPLHWRCVCVLLGSCSADFNAMLSANVVGRRSPCLTLTGMTRGHTSVIETRCPLSISISVSSTTRSIKSIDKRCACSTRIHNKPPKEAGFWCVVNMQRTGWSRW